MYNSLAKATFNSQKTNPVALAIIELCYKQSVCQAVENAWFL